MSEIKRHFQISRLDEDQQIVEGIVCTDQEASDGYIVTREAIEEAWPDYMKFGNVREMHQEIAAGVVQASEMTEAGMMVRVKVVEPSTWAKVKEGVLKAFSIRGPIIEAAGNVINRLKIIEISLVDRPADPGALVTMFRAAGHHTEGQQAQKETDMPKEGREALAAQKPSVKRADEIMQGDGMTEQAETNIMQELSGHLDAIGALVGKFNALHDSEAIAPEVLAHCQNAHRSLGKAMGAHIKASTSYGAKDDEAPAAEGDAKEEDAKRSESIVPHKPSVSRLDELHGLVEKLVKLQIERAEGYKPVVIPETPLRSIDKAESVTRSESVDKGDGYPEVDTPEWNALPEITRCEIIDNRLKNRKAKA